MQKSYERGVGDTPVDRDVQRGREAMMDSQVRLVLTGNRIVVPKGQVDDLKAELKNRLTPGEFDRVQTKPEPGRQVCIWIDR